MNKAAFFLKDYKFEKVNIDFSKKVSNEISVGFEPSGEFYTKNSSFKLTIVFIAFNNKSSENFVSIECITTFQFENKITPDEIPSYFYRNSIAIIFPYIRAFVSTVTLQANIPPIILPTMNLSSLEKPLIEKTVFI